RFSGRLLNTNIFKSSGKYIPTPGTKKIRVIASGGGGGGGGVPETTENQQATAGAGLSGAFIEAFFEVDNDFEVNVIIRVIDNNFPRTLTIHKFIIKSIFNIESIIGNIAVIFREKSLNRWGPFHFHNFPIPKMWTSSALRAFQVTITSVE
ncbi:hypothetical protein ACVN40_23990, partial [Escherichia coli]